MKRMPVLLVLLSAILAVAVSDLRAQSAVEVKPAVDSLQAGFVKMTLAYSTRSFFVAPKALLTIRDVDSASVWSGTSSKGKPSYAVTIHFKQALTDSVERITRANLHKRLAILVDGALVGAPTVVNPITSPNFPVPVPDLAEANRLAAKVNKSLKEVR
jgi:preprotein translocase subunit SecD